MNNAASLHAAPSTSLSAAAAPDTTAPLAASAPVSGAPRHLLRLEALLALALSVVAFRATGAHWGWFAVLFLVPDLAILGYRLGPQRGATIYNVVHTYATPALVAALGAALGIHALLPLAAIWGAHIAFDRVLGFGLKYPTAFTDTHLGSAPMR